MIPARNHAAGIQSVVHLPVAVLQVVDSLGAQVDAVNADDERAAYRWKVFGADPLVHGRLLHNR